MKIRITVIFLLLTGVALRLYDLTDLPLDFHPTRQLFALIKARGMYYSTLTNVTPQQRQTAIDLWNAKTTFEPQIMENIVAFTYRFTDEQIWVARIYSSFFWILGGIFLFLLTRDLATEKGALLSLTFYLFLPYSAIASRSFQPDPLMTMLTIGFWWSIYRWSKTPASWSFAILAGLFGGFAIAAKFIAAFFVIGAGVAALVMSLQDRRFSRQSSFQLSTILLLGILPGASWVIYGTYFSDFLTKKFEGRFIPSLLISPSFYLDWLSMMNTAVGLGFIALALLGIYLYRQRTFPVSLWIAYVVYSIFFDYHISTHDYYSLLLIPITAIFLAPLAELRIPNLKSKIQNLELHISLSLFIIISSFIFTRTLHSIDYHPQAQQWAEINALFPPRAKLTALTEDYGMRLEYWGWKKAYIWPLYGDLAYEDLQGESKGFEKRFTAATNNRDYFIVTLFDQLARQPELQDKLSTYPVFAQTNDYIIYQLK